MSRFLPLREHPLWSRRQWLLGIVFALLGAVAWWQLQRQPVEDASRPPRPRLPDYTVRHFSAVETDASGKPSRHLVAEELRHYPNENISELDQPRMELYETEGPPWLARARGGTVFPGGDRVRLSGDVQLDRAADQTTRPTHLETEQIDILREQGLAETDLPVRIRSDGDSVSANGMRLWYKGPKRTTFHGRARIRLAPEQENQP